MLGGAGWIVVVVSTALFRLSIKSTCWLYWPFAFVMRTPVRSADTELFLKEIINDPWATLQRRIAWATLLLIFVITLGDGALQLLNGVQFHPGGATAADHFATLRASFGDVPKMVSPLEHLFLLDFRELSLWTWLNLGSAAITICAWFYAKRLSLRHEHWKQRNPARLATVSRGASVLERLLSLRVLFVTAVTVIWLTHAVLVFTPISACLSNGAIANLEAFYGRWMPGVPTEPCRLHAWVSGFSGLLPGIGVR